MYRNCVDCKYREATSESSESGDSSWDICIINKLEELPMHLQEIFPNYGKEDVFDCFVEKEY